MNLAFAATMNGPRYLLNSNIARKDSASAFSHRLDPKEKSAIPEEPEHWSVTTLREKLVKIGAKVVRHGRYVTFQLAEVAIPRNPFREILRRVDELRRIPAPA